ncbi:calponin homology domain-containing protein DDB_G0272472-like isoform X1 [Paralichthys olivaceus]|uniref:calponin homology domain-containing protein DDB_G0272472-like isoform X1 n=1 Tax=Paralichthys olivaceus TaxID=8255 RepID=UPI003753551F
MKTILHTIQEETEGNGEEMEEIKEMEEIEEMEGMEEMEEMEEMQEMEEIEDETEDIEELSESEMSDEGADQPKPLQVKRESKVTFYLEDLETNQSKTEESQKQEQEEKEALSKTLKQETVETDNLQAETEHMTAHIGDNKRSDKDQEHRNRLNKILADLKENKEEIVELKTEPQTCDKLHELKQEHFEKDFTKHLESDIEAKGQPTEKKEENQWASELKMIQKNLFKLQMIYETALSETRDKETGLEYLTNENKKLLSQNKRIQGKLEETQKTAIFQEQKVKDNLVHLTSDNHHLTSENKRLHGKLLALISQQKEDADKLDQMTQEINRLAFENKRLDQVTQDNNHLAAENKRLLGELEAGHEAAISHEKETDKINQLKMQKLDSENKRLQRELDDALHERQLARRQHQEDSETCHRLEDELKKEKVRFLTACKKIGILKEASAKTQSMMYNEQPLEVQNKDITARIEAIEAKYDLKFNNRACSQQHDEIVSMKDDINSKILPFIANLQFKEDDYMVQQSESKTRQAQLEDALHQEKTQRAVLEERVSHTASALEKERKRSIKFASALKKERATSKKYSAELKEAMIKQEKTLKDQQCLTLAFQEDPNNLCQVQQQVHFQLRYADDMELKQNVLNEATNVHY